MLQVALYFQGGTEQTANMRHRAHQSRQVRQAGQELIHAAPHLCQRRPNFLGWGCVIHGKIRRPFRRWISFLGHGRSSYCSGLVGLLLADRPCDTAVQKLQAGVIFCTFVEGMYLILPSHHTCMPAGSRCIQYDNHRLLCMTSRCDCSEWVQIFHAVSKRMHIEIQCSSLEPDLLVLAELVFCSNGQDSYRKPQVSRKSTFHLFHLVLHVIDIFSCRRWLLK